VSGTFELVDHTGDVGLRVRAESLEGLFETAATGMLSVMLENPESVRPIQRREMVVRGADVEELFVNWLSELNFLFSTEGKLFSKFRVHSIEMNRTALLKAQIAGEGYDPARHELRLEIKAVTFHKLFVGRRDDHWEAQVIFDI